MKNLLIKLLILGIVSSSMVFVGCKKDDGTEVNQIIFESTDYSLAKGYVHYEEDYKFNVMLLGSGMTYSSEDENFNGQGSYLYLTMYSIEAESLSPGLYTFDRFAPVVLFHDSLTVEEGIIGIDTNFDRGFPEDTLSIASGVVEVKKRGNVYEFNFDFYTTANVELKGLYSGTLDDFTVDYGKGAGSFALQGSNYTLEHGELVLDGPNDSNGYIYDLSLFGLGANYFDAENGVSFTIHSPLNNGLQAGHYVLNNTGANFTIEEGIWERQYTLEEFASGTFPYLGFFESGTIDISKNGRIYTIDYDLMATNSVIGSKQLKGQYIGYLKFQ